MPKPTRADARHEAAHAVVGVRLGLPIASSTLGLQVTEGRHGTGITALLDGSTDRWYHEPDGREKYAAYAVMMAAGVCAEIEGGRDIDAPESTDDLERMYQVADVLGVKREDLQRWVLVQIERARETLHRDDARAWDRVTWPLFRKRRLSGHEIRRLVEESDSLP